MSCDDVHLSFFNRKIENSNSFLLFFIIKTEFVDNRNVSLTGQQIKDDLWAASF